MVMYRNYRNSIGIGIYDFLRLIALRPKYTNQYTRQQQYKQIELCLWARQFSSVTKIYVSRGFSLSPKATDKPKVAVNTRQNSKRQSSGNEFTYSRDQRKWRANPLTDLSQRQKSRFCNITLVDNQVLATVPEPRFLSTITFEKQSTQITCR